MIDEEKRWEAILAQDVKIRGEQGTVTMTMSELLEWLETETGFLKREMRHAFLTQYQRATVHAAEVRLHFAANHYCGMNCDTCGDFSCDICSTCPEMQSGGFCHGNNPEVCERTVDGIIEYSEKLADWVTDFRRKHSQD